MDISKIKKVRAVVNLRTDKKLYPIGTLFEAPFTTDIEAEIRSGSNSLQVEETVLDPSQVAPLLPTASADAVQPSSEPAKRRGGRRKAVQPQGDEGQGTGDTQSEGLGETGDEI